jgi:RNA polymerase sigma-70 factor, ECF subfamily
MNAPLITSHNPPEMEKRKQLVALLTRHQRQLLRYIHTLVPRLMDAEDILQETSQVICEKFDTFQEGTDFMAWACEIAWWRVRAARSAFARSRISCFSDEILELLAETTAEMHGEMDLREEALDSCLKKLQTRDRELVEARYQQGATVASAAQRNGRSLEATYKALARIRRALYECVSQRTALPLPTGGTP